MAAPFVRQALRTPGSPLDGRLRAEMEASFRYDFSRVRIHSDEAATSSARSVDAAAFTVGSDIVFDNARFRPNDSDGRRMLAHELVHVIQQRGSHPDLERLQVDGGPADPLEREASLAAERAVGGTPRFDRPMWTPTSNHLQRAPRPSAHSHPVTDFRCRPPSDHAHRPARDWAARQAVWRRGCARAERSIEDLFRGRIRIEERSFIECICANTSPRQALEAARRGTMMPGGLAWRHVDHYLTGGGRDYTEDLAEVLRNDGGVRRKIARAIGRAGRGCVSIEQSDFSVHDYQFAFGGIDRMDYEVDSARSRVHVWFRDRYEWHPEDTGRPSNCVHRGAVELKDAGAADYWMVGDAVVPLSWFRAGPPSSSGGPTL